MKKYMEYEVEGARPTSRPIRLGKGLCKKTMSST